MTMKGVVLSSISCLFVFFFSLSGLHGYSSSINSEDETGHANLPPRGWNSYDSFSWVITEEQFLQNVELVAQRLKSKGYEYVVVDFLWYRKKVEGAYTDSLGFDVIDEWGRMQPDPGRWPSSAGGRGFTDVAAKVHSMGLKFGIHVMRGVSTQAVNGHTPILDVKTGKAYEEGGRQWYASDVGIKERACAWMKNGFMSVNTKTGAGRAFLRSLYQQYADWGVDFVKHDCVFGSDLDLDEITVVSEVLKELNHPITYSLSPGVDATPALAKEVSGLVNMYRVTGDDWDTWEDVASHFNVARDMAAAGLIGTEGLQGKSWPDLDMLPFGWLTDPGSNEGPHRHSNLTQTEKETQMTLWSMAKSPIMYGGDMRRISVRDLALITNPTLLEINWFSSNNKEFPHVTGTQCSRLRRHTLSHNHESEKCTGTTLDAQVLALRSCKDTKAKGWSHKLLEDDLEQICWKGKTAKHQAPFCLYKRRPLFEPHQETRNKSQINGKLHLLEAETKDSCLTAAPNRKLTSAEASKGSFSNCRWEAYQMWELKRNGTLINNYSGLCASLDSAKATPVGSRAWIASGRQGEIYLAFFNLNKETSVISTTTSDVAKALPERNLRDTTCSGRELWSGKSFGPVKVLSITVQAHGSALFVLNCQ
nr:Glycoside hydrolase [Ipomoea batatas]